MRELLFGLILALASFSASAAQLTVSWTFPTGTDVVAAGVTGIQVERKPALCGTGTAPFVIVGTTAATALSFADTTVIGGSSYCYRVASKGPVNTNNPTGLSSYSGTAEATVPIVLGPYPTPTTIIITIQPQ